MHNLRKGQISIIIQGYHMELFNLLHCDPTKALNSKHMQYTYNRNELWENHLDDIVADKIRDLLYNYIDAKSKLLTNWS